MYKGIVIGCGKIGALLEANEKRPRPRTHASALTVNPKTSLAALVDTNPENLKQASALFPGVPTLSDLKEVLARVRPDIAIVATNPASHALIVEQCVKSGVPIIIGEKPLADSLENAQRIRQAIRKSGATFALNYQRRYFPLFAHAKKRLAADEIGRIHTIECRYDNGLFNNGGHAIDSMQFLIGNRIAHVSGTVNARNPTYPESDPNIDGEGMMQNGVQIFFKSFDQKISPIHELHVSGENGSLHVLDYGYSFEWSDTSGKTTRSERDEVSMTAGALEDALDAYEKKRSPLSGTPNGIETLTVLEAFSESAKHNGKRVEVAYTG